jgi:predicted HNH restriction endonuclease
MIEKATEVHHKDGQFRFNEPLFSLVSVCSTCHRIITEIEQTRNAKETDKIKYKFDKE